MDHIASQVSPLSVICRYVFFVVFVVDVVVVVLFINCFSYTVYGLITLLFIYMYSSRY